MATMTSERLSTMGCCPVCGWEYVLRVDGSMRAHWDDDGAWCDGSGRTDPRHIRTVEVKGGRIRVVA